MRGLLLWIGGLVVALGAVAIALSLPDACISRGGLFNDLCMATESRQSTRIAIAVAGLVVGLVLWAMSYERGAA